jgi:hypothetical protein
MVNRGRREETHAVVASDARQNGAIRWALDPPLNVQAWVAVAVIGKPSSLPRVSCRPTAVSFEK